LLAIAEIPHVQKQLALADDLRNQSPPRSMRPTDHGYGVMKFAF
jgi:hypothetical protein